ncbi:MAG: ATP-binding cassette domain-containing protein [Chloroflexota bacterium]
MIELRSVSFRFPDGTRVFENFNWHVAQGEAWSVLGPSGCGKTTLLYLLAGLLHPTAGEVRVGGERLERPRPRTGLILQDYGLLPWATVRENAALGLRVRGFYGPDGKHAPPDEVIEHLHERLDPWLDRLGLNPVADHYPSQISGGQRQRTAIARTLALNPDLLLMDEPFASLDAPTREGLQDLTLQLQRERSLTTVVVTHAIEEAALLGQNVLVLGALPNCQAHIVENAGAGRGEYRETTEYAAICARLRQVLEALR